jgi:DNA-binding transcriptional ArsR family regulator
MGNERVMMLWAQGAAVQELLNGLGNRHRRRILKLAIEVGTPLSPSMASEKLPASLSTIGKHFRVLAEVGLLTLVAEVPNRGATEHLYVPVEDLANHPIVQAVLCVCNERKDLSLVFNKHREFRIRSPFTAPAFNFSITAPLRTHNFDD